MNRIIIKIVVLFSLINGCKSFIVINESDNINTIEISAADFEKLLDTNNLPPYSNGYLTRIRGRGNVDIINLKFTKIEFNPLDSLLYIEGAMCNQQNNNYEFGQVIIGQLPNLLEKKIEYPLTIFKMINLKNKGEFEVKVKIKDNMQLFFGSKLFSKLKTYNIYKLIN